jgi:hypothetical protein
MLQDWFERCVRPLPEDPARLREWSAVMALTGALNAIERGIVPPGHEIVLHGSGYYTDADYVVAKPDAEVSTVDEIAEAVLGARR